MNDQTVIELIKQHKPGHALDTAFYTDASIYEQEIERIFTKVWLYAGHQSEIPKRGDYRLFNVAGESVIIIRGQKNEINALLNVCRHRGSRLTTEQTGCAKRLTCPYHGWTYDLNGKLIAAAHMTAGFDKSEYSLKKVQHRVFEGMIFINFAENPKPFDVIEKDLAPYLAPFHLDQAKVAYRQSYKINSNWKFAVENYKECYHCGPAHPEYSRAHSLALPEDKYEEELKTLLQRMPMCGLSGDVMDRSYITGEEWSLDRAWEHYPLLRGHVTGSKDGKAVAPLMGDITGYDSGAHDFKVGPFLFALAYADHVVLYRFTPLSINQCDCDVTWLVNGSAREGKDYDLDKLIWLWDVTTHADKKIIQDNHDGVMSRYFKPGPFSTFEDATERWVGWYLKTME